MLLPPFSCLSFMAVALSCIFYYFFWQFSIPFYKLRYIHSPKRNPHSVPPSHPSKHSPYLQAFNTALAPKNMQEPLKQSTTQMSFSSVRSFRVAVVTWPPSLRCGPSSYLFLTMQNSRNRLPAPPLLSKPYLAHPFFLITLPSLQDSQANKNRI